MNRFLFLLIPLLFFSYARSQSLIYGVVKSEGGLQIDDAVVYLQGTAFLTETDHKGRFRLTSIPAGNYRLVVFAYGYATQEKDVQLQKDSLYLELLLTPLAKELDAVEIQAQRIHDLGVARLNGVEGAAIYEAKKTEVVELKNIQANLSTNNPRQVFGKITGLHIWESDAAGLQLGVGGRGLSPNRTANFNTRQNGYDISADALGYPESYYTPPMEALERVEVIRGAASLQYGTQFGGMLNFVTRTGAARPLEVTLRQTGGSYGYYGNFTSVGGTTAGGKLNHYTYYQYKRGDGWRENSAFQAHTAGSRWIWKSGRKWTQEAEITYMHYLAQQPGGLTDAAFEDNARQSLRKRNWFRINWLLGAVQQSFEPDSLNLFQFRTFALSAGRGALGNLERINRVDLGGNRNLIEGQFANIGQEGRWRRKYFIGKKEQTSLLGYRIYYGSSRARQGDADNGSGAVFKFLNPDYVESGDFDFNNWNVSLFWENIFRITPRWSIIPGARFEFIETAASGYYRQRVLDAAGNVIVDNRIDENSRKPRRFMIAGLGTQYKLGRLGELYANITQNYRAINFTDLRVNNPNLVVDSNLRDERGFTSDLGWRGQKRGVWTYELTLFYLYYQGKIGQVLRTGGAPLYQDYRFRTNVSDAANYGVEALLECNLLRLRDHKRWRKMDLSLFTNFSWIQARYIRTADNSIRNKQVEMVPPLMIRGGVSYRYRYFSISWQSTYTAEHFSDATNSIRSSSAVEGLIPSYLVSDVSARWTRKSWSVEASLNNVLDARYFTRRADSYPGPGIIPADARAFYLTLGKRF